jgi:hypothetical protein
MMALAPHPAVSRDFPASQFQIEGTKKNVRDIDLVLNVDSTKPRMNPEDHFNENGSEAPCRRQEEATRINFEYALGRLSGVVQEELKNSEVIYDST